MLEAEIIALPAAPHITLAPQAAIVSLTAFRHGAAPLRAALGVDLPATPRRITADGTDYLWSGPDSWLAVAADDTLALRLAETLRGHAAVTDQSDGRVVLHVSGRHARAALSRLVPIDLHLNAFLPGATALTLAGGITVQIWQPELGVFALACFRSFAHALHHALAVAMASAIDGDVSF